MGNGNGNERPEWTKLQLPKSIHGWIEVIGLILVGFSYYNLTEAKEVVNNHNQHTEAHTLMIAPLIQELREQKATDDAIKQLIMHQQEMSGIIREQAAKTQEKNEQEHQEILDKLNEVMRLQREYNGRQ